MKYVFLTILLLVPLISSASENTLIRFTIKPNLCVLLDESDKCRDDITITWESRQAMNVCIFKLHHQQPLACWNDHTHGAYSIYFVTGSTTEFFLKEMTTENKLSRVLFDVIQNDKKYRRKRRSSWSFF